MGCFEMLSIGHRDLGSWRKRGDLGIRQWSLSALSWFVNALLR